MHTVYERALLVDEVPQPGLGRYEIDRGSVATIAMSPTEVRSYRDNEEIIVPFLDWEEATVEDKEKVFFDILAKASEVTLSIVHAEVFTNDTLDKASAMLNNSAYVTGVVITHPDNEAAVREWCSDKEELIVNEWCPTNVVYVLAPAPFVGACPRPGFDKSREGMGVINSDAVVAVLIKA
ncbi:MAG: hypothetical protein JSS66_06250 [Armatimonadetes bacterium]|nr:hypothetical protein [Armatimonadota bacterium]